MKATCWMGANKVEVQDVPDPKILNARDAIVELGPAVTNLRVGDRVVVPFTIACGNYNACRRSMFSICENSNPNAGLAEKLWGQSPAGVFGYSHLLGGYAGGQAEYARVPFADVGPPQDRG